MFGRRIDEGEYFEWKPYGGYGTDGQSKDSDVEP
ncbi:hypothetical protein ZOD2009_17880 [Haladaptatus paucihalophilus DX253]|uniref:Uncharacterized protein n=1 Tax=Haladaptatus paucihalophilus DX253 TaxID=797209 RepID=E7QXN7_HALPU|nr:hypothetical protein ZOD2009_17880 [Haladaptatus paucihalophilus DX253]